MGGNDIKMGGWKSGLKTGDFQPKQESWNLCIKTPSSPQRLICQKQSLERGLIKGRTDLNLHLKRSTIW